MEDGESTWCDCAFRDFPYRALLDRFCGVAVQRKVILKKSLPERLAKVVTQVLRSNFAASEAHVF
jgi:hypothetical protein